MADKEEFLSFDKVLKELKLKEEELKRLVSEGEIRAFRDADKMKFKKEDVDRLKKDTGKTIQFTEESGETLTDDLLFDEDDLKLADEDAGMATAQISNEDTFIDEKSKKAAPAAGSKKPAEAPKKVEAKKITSTRTTTSARAGTPSTTGATVRRTSTRSQTIAKSVRSTDMPMYAVLAVFAGTLLLLWGVAFVRDISEGRMGSLTEPLAKSAEEWFSKPNYPEIIPASLPK